MTFDEWCEKEQAMYKSIENKEDLYCLLQNTWNAAIAAAQLTLTRKDYFNDNGGGSYPEDDIDWLLTQD